MDINKEAEEYAKSKWPSTSVVNDLIQEGFIAGANSKYAQAEKLKFAIEAVLQFRKATFGLGNSGLEQLQQQLKELENE
jgi:polyhydroxyalkanoate synthesis regulator phasin